jgi:palmitoyltransferase
MEFLKDLFKNPHFANTLADRIASSVFVIGGIFTIWYEVMILYYYNKGSLNFPMDLIHLTVAGWLYIGAMTNWYKLISTRTFGYFNELQQKQDYKWKYCDSCFGFYPPRTHHCIVCKVCILKRDHHCWFAGSCIGYHNHRYYFTMVIYIFMAALYCNVFNYSFVMDKLEGFCIGTVVCLLVPHACALFGYLTFEQFFLCILSFIGFLCLVMFTWLLVIQLQQIIAGQTQFEKKNKIRDYDLGIKANFIEVLGSRYYLTWITSWITSNLPGDGIVFTKQHKDL